MSNNRFRVFCSALVALLSTALVLQGCALPVKQVDSLERGEAQYAGLDDPNYHTYLQESVYEQVVEELDSEEYLVGNVEVRYISREYLRELSYNSQENIFFGYSLAELDEYYDGEKYVFTAEDGETTTQTFNSIQDARFDETIENIAIGGSVILVCVTVSAVAAPAAPAVSMIFVASAKGAAAFGALNGAIGAVSAGVAKQIETGNFEEALKEAAYVGSEGFKMGTIAGAVTGGSAKASSIKGMTKNGLTWNEAAKIQKESKWPASIIGEIKNLDEYQIYEDAGLRAVKINGRDILVPDIDWNAKFKSPDGAVKTNLERMQAGLTPLDPNGVPYQVHHVAQNPDGVFAILTERQHIGNNGVLNTLGKKGVPHEGEFQKQKRELWKGLAELVLEEVGK